MGMTVLPDSVPGNRASLKAKDHNEMKSTTSRSMREQEVSDCESIVREVDLSVQSHRNTEVWGDGKAQDGSWQRSRGKTRTLTSWYDILRSDDRNDCMAHWGHWERALAYHRWSRKGRKGESYEWCGHGQNWGWWYHYQTRKLPWKVRDAQLLLHMQQRDEVLRNSPPGPSES